MRYDDRVSIKRDPSVEEIELVFQHGKKYQSALLPPDIQTGPVGMCFDWSMLECMRLKERYRYVEGLAKDPEDKKWELHAWLTDGIHAFDATWHGRRPLKPGTHPKTKYIGIEMPLLSVILFVKATQYQGVIPNREKYPYTLQQILSDKEKS